MEDLKNERKWNRSNRISGTPDKGSRTSCTLPGVFDCSGKGQTMPLEGVLREISNRRCGQTPGKPERNAVSRKGDVMGMARAGNRKTALSLKHYIFLYIAQLLLRGLRTFFIRHITVFFPIRVFLLWACLSLCGCAFCVF